MKQSVALKGLFLTFLLTLASTALAMKAPPDHLLHVVNSPAVVKFHQLDFVLPTGRLLDTDWGRVSVDAQKLRKQTGLGTAYINVFISGRSARAGTLWVVDNLLVPEEFAGMEPTERRGRTAGRTDLGRFGKLLGASFDLRPDERGAGPIDRLAALVLATSQPLPQSFETIALADSHQPTIFRVESSLVNADGALETVTEAEDPPIGSGDPLPPPLISGPPSADLIGDPPPPIPPLATPPDSVFTQAVFQKAGPNIHSASNQCVPIAYANALQYLEDRYDGFPLAWRLPQDHFEGLGEQQANPDILVWLPEPPEALLSHLDAFTKRTGTFSYNQGKGTGRCQMARGVFGYLTAFGQLAQTKFRHQSHKDLPRTDGNLCEDGMVDMGGMTSERLANYPTWEWMFEQLQLGRGLVMLYGRFAINGAPSGGHMLRVWGAAATADKKFIYTLDDATQGGFAPNYSEGLRWKRWQVADTGQPGLAGVPDGRLNLDNSSWEIKWAVSIEPLPTLDGIGF